MQDKLSKLIDFLQGREGLFLVLVGALFVQAPHTAEVFHRISTSGWWAPFSILHCVGFAIVLELAVLLFVVRGRKRLSWSFAGISVLMNVFYYYSALWWSAPGTVWPDIVKCVVTAIALPLAIAFYSHEVAVPGVVPAARKTKPTQTTPPVVQLEFEELHNDEAEATQSQPTQEPDATTDKRQRATQLRSEGLSYAQIADELDVHRNTIANWLKATNGHKEAV